MALTRELKAYINKRYEARSAEIQKRKSDSLSNARKNHEEDVRQIAQDTSEVAVKDLQDILEALQEKGFTLNYSGKDFKKKGIFDLVNLPQFQEVAKVSKIYDRQIELVEAEREKLLVMLSLEKNFEKINELLKEYDIQF